MAPNTEILLNGATRTNARVTRHGPVFCNTHKDYGISNSCSGILSISTGREGDFTGMRVSRRRFFLFALFILFIIAVSPAFAPPALAAENPAGSTVTEGETASAGDAADAEAKKKTRTPLERFKKNGARNCSGGSGGTLPSSTSDMREAHSSSFGLPRSPRAAFFGALWQAAGSNGAASPAV